MSLEGNTSTVVWVLQRLRLKKKKREENPSLPADWWDILDL